MTDQFDILGQTAQEAEEGAVRANYGKMAIAVTRYVQWKDRVAVEVTPDVYSKLPRGNKTLEVSFSLDLAEFNPALQFEYTRRVNIPSPDWHKIVKKSIIAVLGKDAAKNYGQTFKDLNGKYVEVHDVPQVKGDEFNTLKLVRVFGDRNEAFNAYVARYGQPDENATPQTAEAPTGFEFPPGYDEASWKDMIPYIKTALENGQSPVEVADAYNITPKFVMDAKNS